MMGWSHCFQGIYRYFGELKVKVTTLGELKVKVTTQQPWALNPGPLDPASDALPLGHQAPVEDDDTLG